VLSDATAAATSRHRARVTKPVPPVVLCAHPRDWPADGCPPEPSRGRFFVPAPRCRGAARVLTLPSRRAKRCPPGGSMTAAG